jgi:transposase-like protein
MPVFRKVIIEGMNCPFCNSKKIIVIAEELLDGRQLFRCACKECKEFWAGHANVSTGGYQKHQDGEIL